MTQNINQQKPTPTEIAPCLDGQSPANEMSIDKPAAKHSSDTQEPTKSARWMRATSSDYGRMAATAWASDMYDICGGDGEGNAYLGDGISITPDGDLVDD